MVAVQLQSWTGDVLLEQALENYELVQRAVFAVPVYQNQIYLTKRVKDPKAGLFSVVGGKPKNENTLETALLRELGEELYSKNTLDDTPLTLLHDAIFDATTGFYCTLYVAQIPDNKFTLAKGEATEAKLLGDLLPEQVNPLSRLVLYELGKNRPDLVPKKFRQFPKDIIALPITRIEWCEGNYKAYNGFYIAYR